MTKSSVFERDYNAGIFGPFNPLSNRPCFSIHIYLDCLEFSDVDIWANGTKLGFK